MVYTVSLKKSAMRDLKKLPKKDAARILAKIELMKDELKGDVKRLTNFTPEYRMRTGSYRILFELEDETIVVYAVKHRKESYR